MLDKLKSAEIKYEGIAEKLSDPETIGDIDTYKSLMREHKALTPIIEKYREWRRIKENADEARAIIEGGDRELRELAEEELGQCREKLETAETELRKLLLPRDPMDDKNVIVEIRAGAGGEEAALFAYVLYRMYTMYAEREGYHTEIINENDTELGGFKEVSFLIEGDGAYSKMKFESGVHRVQRVPETESQGRIHTSTVTVAVLPEAEEVEVELNAADVVVETIKSTGAGGQHVNKTESAIRLIHKPTGIVVECQDERSQYKNKDKAFKLLRTKLFDMKQSEQNEKLASERRSQVGTGDRSERIRTYNYPQGRVTDHRIGVTLYSLDTFLNGDIGRMIESLIAYNTAEKLNKGAAGEDFE